MKLVLSPVGAALTRFCMAVALAGLRSDWPAPKVTWRPALFEDAALFAVLDTGGAGGAEEGADGAGAIGASATLGGGVIGSVAAGAVAGADAWLGLG